jgi:hypothetical protein
VAPFDWLGDLVVKPNVGHEFLVQVLHRRKDSASNDVSFDFRESDFDLVEP